MCLFLYTFVYNHYFKSTLKTINHGIIMIGNEKKRTNKKDDKKAIPAKDKKVLTKKEKTLSIIRKIIYLLMFALVIFGFVYLSNKYENKDTEEKYITDYYKDLKSEKYEVINGTQMINYVKRGKNIIIIGSETSEWSKKLMTIVDPIFDTFGIDKVYYYDINNDKAQKNSNYYKIKELLKGSLTTTDGSNSNLLAPSIYIVDNGKVLYYNTDTVAMKNTIEIDEYWNEENLIKFQIEFEQALVNYYLNNN